MTDQPTYRKALTAAKEAESQGMAVREIVVDGRKFRLIMGGVRDVDTAAPDLVDMTAK